MKIAPALVLPALCALALSACGLPEPLRQPAPVSQAVQVSLDRQAPRWPGQPVGRGVAPTDALWIGGAQARDDLATLVPPGWQPGVDQALQQAVSEVLATAAPEGQPTPFTAQPVPSGAKLHLRARTTLDPVPDTRQLRASVLMQGILERPGAAAQTWRVAAVGADTLNLDAWAADDSAALRANTRLLAQRALTTLLAEMAHPTRRDEGRTRLMHSPMPFSERPMLGAAQVLREDAETLTVAPQAADGLPLDALLVLDRRVARLRAPLRDELLAWRSTD